MQSKKVYIIGLGVIVLALAAYFVALPMWQKKQIEKIQAIVEQFPGCSVESIEPKNFGKDFVLHNVVLRFEFDNNLVLDSQIREITLSGLNFLGVKEDATKKILDSLTLANATTVLSSVTTTDNKEATVLFKHTADKMGIEGLMLNVPAMQRAFAAENIMAEIYKLDYSVNLSSSSNVRLEIFESWQPEAVAVVTYEKETSKDISALKSGASEIEKMLISVGAEPTVSIGKISLQSASMPRLDLDENLPPEQLAVSFAEAFKLSPLNIDALRFADVKFLRGSDAPVALESVELSVLFDDVNGKITWNISNLILPAGFLNEDNHTEVDIALPADGATPPQAEGAEQQTAVAKTVKQSPPNDVKISSLLDIRSVREASKFTIKLNPISVLVDSLGEFSLAQETSFTIEGASPDMWFFEMMASNALHNLDFKIKDTGGRMLVAELALAEDKEMLAAEQVFTAQELLAKTAAEIRTDAESGNEAFRQLALAIATFVEKGGALNISLAPTEPIGVNELNHVMMISPERLNMKITNLE